MMLFRYDINALRALAVSAVILYHFEFMWFKGGFLGVDIFFVISGYLMTAILCSDNTPGPGYIVGFYLARARRIIPAAFMMIVSLIIIGWYLLPTNQYQALGKEIAFSATFLSNFGYFISTGYFDASSNEKFLLHTWSLSVEAQFYFLYPLFLYILKKITTNLLIPLTLIFASSLIIYLVLQHSSPGAAFYLLPARAWELLAGALVFINQKEKRIKLKNQKSFSIIGILGLIASFVLVEEASPNLGLLTLITVFCTCIVLSIDENNLKFFHFKLVQWLGERSYSAYLWHWPIVVALHFSSKISEWRFVALAILLTIILSNLSFRLIENPMRVMMSRLSELRQAIILTTLTITLITASLMIYFLQLDNRLPAVVELAANESLNRDPRREICFEVADIDSPGCVYPDNSENPLGGYLIGDSHAASVVTAFGTAANQYNKAITFYGRIGCPTIQGLRRINSKCFEFNEWIYNKAITELEKDTPVILASRLSVYIKGHNETKAIPLAYFKQPVPPLGDKLFIKEYTNKLISSACSIARVADVYIMMPIPEMPVNVPKILSRSLIFDRNIKDYRISREIYNLRNAEVISAIERAKKTCDVKVLYPTDYLCDEHFCYGSKNLRPLYYDSNHLSEYGNKLLIPMFKAIFRN